MLPKHETLSIEFKSVHQRFEEPEIIEAVVGMMNTSGGTIYIGIEDSGEVSGVLPEQMDAVRLSAMIANQIIPSPSVRVDEIEIHGKRVITVDVPQSPMIASTTSGKTLRRRNRHDGSPETVPMYPHEFTSRLSDLSLLDSSARVLDGATADDLDPSERNRLRAIIKAFRGEAAILELEDAELDLALQLVKRIEGIEIPTLAGMLLIGREESLRRLVPTSGIAFQVLVNSDIRLNETLYKPLLASFESVQEYLKAWNPELEVEIGLHRIAIPDFDPRAFREALVNAIAHRDYSLLRTVRIQIDNDGMTVASPGGFVEGITLANLLTAEPRSRNPALADALKRIGLAERTGRGIDRIFEGSLHYGRPLPDYSGSDATTVHLFIPKANPDRAFTKMISEAISSRQYQLNVFAMMILNHLRDVRRANLQAIIDGTGIELARVRSSVERLVEEGFVEASGTGRGRTYHLSSRTYKSVNDLKSYVRQTDIDRIRHPEMILKLARQKGGVTRRDVMELLHLTETQAYRQLKSLVADGQLVLNGTKRRAVYHPVGAIKKNRK